MKKIDNLFPTLFALAGITFVVWGIAAGATPSNTNAAGSGGDNAKSRLEHGMPKAELE